ncbi:FG-GAP repeat domain-containing protein [Streptomyces phyllanthi]|uniref:VCBS repeat-containing protein n=1 Tax=Streptomyces phyllanthi TaxID=1803180 RepID=A0A5N8VWP1_9ACTN|nr:VCBS repeat-containing protein [Streptomyces phyllanthi]MPY39681.1 VCBS repeat-containing protein [Streptomyces phyllanthi]
MKSRTALPVFAVCAACVVLAPLAGCGGGGTGDEAPVSGAPAESRAPTGTKTSNGRVQETSVPVPGAPAESRAPAPGKGSKDPDDINGDGYRDFVVPVPGGERVAVLYGSAKGLDPSTRTVHSRRDLGLPERPEEAAESNPLAPETVADLDSDGFPDFVTTVMGESVEEQGYSTVRTVPYVTWGGPDGPRARAGAPQVRLPQSASKMGLESVERGDFDGDGHHDLAGIAKNRSSLVVLYGPFTRSGAPARTSTDLPLTEGRLVVDAIDPSGEPRATSLLLHEPNDGEQSGNILYPARRGTGLSTNGKQLREGNARAFGDFDGDGLRDVAVGDDGGRNDEPGYETEEPEVAGSLAVYPGSGGEPVTYRLPEVPEGAGTDYGPGGFVAADPDGDGRDGILVATYEGATLIDGDRRTPVQRNVRKGPAKWRHTRPAGAADFNGDGKDELILNWAAGTLFGLYGLDPTHWWITDGTTSRDTASFAAAGLAQRS